MRNYGVIAKPITNLLKRGSFKWTAEAEGAFQQLKAALVSSPVLALPDLQKPFTVEIDAFQTCIGAMLMQEQHLIALISKTLSPKNQLLSVYDRELLTAVYAVDKWYHYLSV